MQLNFHSIVVYVLLIRYGVTVKQMMKPNFVPYCTTREKCRSACTCEITPNCSLVATDESIRNSILFYHNRIRDIQSLAEPQPAGMTMLKYDLELEEISKCWASRCDDDYTDCFMTSNYHETSQAVGQIDLEHDQVPNNIMWIQIINYWLGSAKTLTVGAVNRLPAGEEGEILHNYAQIMSDRILAVGCAWSLLDTYLTFVCTYGPKGPLQGDSIYRAGHPCSLCPKYYACDDEKPFSRLCKTIEQPIIPSVKTPPRPPPQQLQSYPHTLTNTEKYLQTKSLLFPQNKPTYLPATPPLPRPSSLFVSSKPSQEPTQLLLYQYRPIHMQSEPAKQEYQMKYTLAQRALPQYEVTVPSQTFDLPPPIPQLPLEPPPPDNQIDPQVPPDVSQYQEYPIYADVTEEPFPVPTVISSECPPKHDFAPPPPPLPPHPEIGYIPVGSPIYTQPTFPVKKKAHKKSAAIKPRINYLYCVFSFIFISV
ncbi:hypothetical protein HHI36_012440 [Cryptolaemus montrouzieri]|uniref:SCP domain-containing protein n=1 Tax=Cryptolaemus montrouzieri TaxID=559131 RepID=A0ABD2NEZ4_9CUCU